MAQFKTLSKHILLTVSGVYPEGQLDTQLLLNIKWELSQVHKLPFNVA